MSSNKQNDAVLYSLQDMKSMGSGGGQSASAAANVRPIQKPKGKWASDDDAAGLLAGILDDTESVAREEEARRLKELEQKERQKKDQEAAEEARKRDEAERRLREEEERRRQAEVRRTGLLRAIEGPSKEEIEAERRAEEEARNRAAMEAKLAEAERKRLEAERMAAEKAREAQIKEQQRLEALARQAEAPPKKSNTGLIIGIVAAVVGVLLVGGLVAAFALGGNNEPQAVSYAKTTLDAQGFTTTSVEKDFQGIYTPPPVAEETATPSKASRPRGNATAGKGKAKATGEDPTKSKKGRNFGNVFGGNGGIVF